MPQLPGEHGGYFPVGDLDSSPGETGGALGFDPAKGKIHRPEIAKMALALQFLAQAVE
jgi:hypothetical protein